MPRTKKNINNISLQENINLINENETVPEITNVTPNQNELSANNSEIVHKSKRGRKPKKHLRLCKVANHCK